MSNIGIVCDNCGKWVQGITWVNGMKFCAKCYQETFGVSKNWQLLDKDRTVAEQSRQIADLEAKLAEYEKVMKNHECESIEKLNGRLYRYDQYEIKFLNMEEEIKDLKQQLTDAEEHIEDLELQLREQYQLIDEKDEQLAKKEKSNEYFANRVEKADKEIKENYKNYNKLVEEYNQLKQQLVESEKKYKKAYQEGLLQKQFDKDMEITQLKQQLKEKDKEIKEYNKASLVLPTKSEFEQLKKIINEHLNQDKISFAVEQLEKVKTLKIKKGEVWSNGKIIDYVSNIYDSEIDDLIKQLKEKNV